MTLTITNADSSVTGNKNVNFESGTIPNTNESWIKLVSDSSTAAGMFDYN